VAPISDVTVENVSPDRVILWVVKFDADKLDVDVSELEMAT